MSQTLPEPMRESVREITHLYVAPEARRKKLATMLLNLVCQEADANGITLMLTARPADDQMAEDALVKWYQQFGFRPLQEGPAGYIMARQVHVRPRIADISRARVNRAVRMALVDVH
jgi:ribosomal protein S18 acetylase RimI-like enzyme